MSFWFLAWSPARTPVRSKNWQLQPKRQQKWHVYPFIPPQFLCLISADTPMPSWTNPNLTGGNKFDKAKTPDSEETAVVADVRDRQNWSALADQRKPNVLLGGTLGGGAPVTLALGDRGPGHPRNLACAMAGSDVLDFERVLERRHRLCDDVVWGDDEMEAADDQTNFRIDGHRRLDDPFDSRVRAADHEHHAVRGINRKR